MNGVAPVPDLVGMDADAAARLLEQFCEEVLPLQVQADPAPLPNSDFGVERVVEQVPLGGTLVVAGARFRVAVGVRRTGWRDVAQAGLGALARWFEGGGSAPEAPAIARVAQPQPPERQVAVRARYDPPEDIICGGCGTRMSHRSLQPGRRHRCPKCGWEFVVQ